MAALWDSTIGRLSRTRFRAASRYAATSLVYSGGTSDRTVYSSPPMKTRTAFLVVVTRHCLRHAAREKEDGRPGYEVGPWLHRYVAGAPGFQLPARRLGDEPESAPARPPHHRWPEHPGAHLQPSGSAGATRPAPQRDCVRPAPDRRAPSGPDVHSDRSRWFSSTRRSPTITPPNPEFTCKGRQQVALHSI